MRPTNLRDGGEDEAASGGPSRRGLLRFAAALTAGSLSLASSCRRAAGSQFTVAAVLPRTGARAPWGEDLARGIELAIEAVNARGGVHGKPVRLVALDDHGRDEEVAALAARACDREGASVLLGGVSSVAAERMAAVAQRRTIAFVATGSTARDLSRANEFSFRTALTDAEHAGAMAKHLRSSMPGKRRAAVAYRRSSMLYLTVGDAFTRAFRGAGGEVVLRDSFGDDDAELVQLASRIRNTGAEVLYVPAVAADAARMALAARHGRVTAQFAGTDGWNAPELRRFAGDAVQGALVTEAFAPTATRPVVERFNRDFRERFHALPGSLAALGFDAARWVLAAAARVSLGDAHGLRDALLSSRHEDAVAGAFSVDAQRALTRAVHVLRVESTGLALVGAASP